MTDNRTTIRGIDPETMDEARIIVRNRKDYTMGLFVSDALEFFVENHCWEVDEDSNQSIN